MSFKGSASIGTTLNFLREQGYWSPLGRLAVKSDYPVCKKFSAFAYKYPKQGRF